MWIHEKITRIFLFACSRDSNRVVGIAISELGRETLSLLTRKLRNALAANFYFSLVWASLHAQFDNECGDPLAFLHDFIIIIMNR